MMNYPTVLCILSTLFFLNFNINDCPDCIPSDTFVLSIEETALRDELRTALADDQLAKSQETVKIEFEFHDLFINETILDMEMMQKYQMLLRKYGVAAGPQRQIHLLADGKILIGDFNDWGELLDAPIRLGAPIAFND